MAKAKQPVAKPSELAVREARKMPIIRDGKIVKVVGIGGDIEITRPGTKPNTVIKEATPEEYAELHNENTAHLIELEGGDDKVEA